MTDPVTLAREVLAIDTSAIGGNIIVDGVDVLETVRIAQKVARAVIELAAQLDAERFAHANTAVKVKGAEALADKLDREASEYLGRPAHSQAGDRIRAALNGDDA